MIDLPRDETADAEEIQRRAMVREIAWLQAVLAHNRSMAAGAEGNRAEEGANAELCHLWAQMWRRLTEEDEEDEAAIFLTEVKGDERRRGGKRRGN
jgi:hypothetical protein